jgi:hypothetical protein
VTRRRRRNATAAAGVSIPVAAALQRNEILHEYVAGNTCAFESPRRRGGFSDRMCGPGPRRGGRPEGRGVRECLGADVGWGEHATAEQAALPVGKTLSACRVHKSGFCARTVRQEDREVEKAWRIAAPRSITGG